MFACLLYKASSDRFPEGLLEEYVFFTSFSASCWGCSLDALSNRILRPGLSGFQAQKDHGITDSVEQFMEARAGWHVFQWVFWWFRFLVSSMANGHFIRRSIWRGGGVYTCKILYYVHSYHISSQWLDLVHQKHQLSNLRVVPPKKFPRPKVYSSSFPGSQQLVRQLDLKYTPIYPHVYIMCKGYVF